MGSSNPVGISATSYSGNTTELSARQESTTDGSFTFKDNERITKFSIARAGTQAVSVSGVKFTTDAGNNFQVLGTVFSNAGAPPPVWQDIPVGSGLIARISGTNCAKSNKIFRSFGVDFLDDLQSISITNMDYAGFANSILPAGEGTQVSVGSQVLDNRNSSVSQTISLQTTDAVTRSRTVTTQVRALVGGAVTMDGKVGIPLVSQGGISVQANWQLEKLNVSHTPPPGPPNHHHYHQVTWGYIQENIFPLTIYRFKQSEAEMSGSTTTRAATFSLVCPAGKFCTAKAFFNQFKLDVNMNATLTATTKSGQTFNWLQSGTYKGADSLAMQFNVTEVDRIS
jgi:hypothetical protein